jgi:hypothetical protein
MTAVEELDKQIKEAQKQVDDVTEERKQSLEVEKGFAMQRLKDEEKQKHAESDRKKEARKMKDAILQEEGLKKAIEDSKGLFENARKIAEAELEEEIQHAKDEEMKRCVDDMESQIASASGGFDKDIAKVRREMEKARNALAKLDAKMATLEIEYKALTADEAAQTEAVKREASSSGGPPDVVSMIASIKAQNKRRAAEAHLLALSMASEEVDDIMSPEFEHATQALLGNRTDPKYRKTAEEWSKLTRQVTGLADALYSEPSEAPFYEHNERTHARLGPSIKEYIRDKNRRLLEHWTELAQEYSVRRHLYDKQQSKKAKKIKRGSVSVGGRKSILGVADKTGLERGGTERGSNVLESGGRSSNNPYRRARRGNEVRSEYEQEQIIAEIAAKEAMEKRITHGGSKLPRQICHLERVSPH